MTAKRFIQRWGKYLNPKAMQLARRAARPMNYSHVHMYGSERTIKYFHSRVTLLVTVLALNSL
jgi:hypothetical protein